MRKDLLYYGKFVAHGIGYIAGQLELTSNCNQRCAFCKSWKDHKSGKVNGNMRFEVVQGILEQLNSIPYFENLTFTGGEPQSWEPLDKLLSTVVDKLHFSLCVNTTMNEDVNENNWRKFRAMRVSLDSIFSDTYKSLRGVDINPETIIERLERLRHPNWSTMTCVSNKNVGEMPDILDRLAKMKCHPRKVMFLPVLGQGKNVLDIQEYIVRARALKNLFYPFQTNFAESARTLMQDNDISKVPCFVGRVSFHIKANGDVFPCCLAGGEAIETIKGMSFGNIYEDSLETIRKRHMELPLHYSSEDSVCRKICQWKQMKMNINAAEAVKIKISMP